MFFSVTKACLYHIDYNTTMEWYDGYSFGAQPILLDKHITFRVHLFLSTVQTCVSQMSTAHRNAYLVSRNKFHSLPLSFHRSSVTKSHIATYSAAETVTHFSLQWFLNNCANGAYASEYTLL